MWKLIFFALIGIVVYYGYQDLSSPKGEFGVDGQPKTVLFVMERCPPCKQAEEFLKTRRISYERLNIENDPEAKNRIKSYGNLRLPTLVVGDSVVSGYYHSQFVASLIKQLGADVLPRGDKVLYRPNFDKNGRPRVVMYGTKWCGYCKKAKEYFESENILYTEWDIEADPNAAKRFELLQGNGTPLIFIGYERVNGFDYKKVNRILKGVN